MAKARGASEMDLDFLASVVDDGHAPGERRRRLATDPTALEWALDQPYVLAHLYAARPAPPISPWLLFALYLRQARRDLSESPPIPEWTRPREIVPVLDARVARDALEDGALRLALENLLTAFARLRGPVTLRLRDGRRTRLIALNDLAPETLARALPYATPEVQGDLMRRMADAHLFLAGVHPEHVVGARGRDLGEWEQAGQGLYRAAAVRYEATAPTWAASLERMAASFHAARRALNYVRERYLATDWPAWFEPAARDA